MSFAIYSDEIERTCLVMELLCSAAETGVTQDEEDDGSILYAAIERVNAAREANMIKALRECGKLSDSDLSQVERKLGRKVEFAPWRFRLVDGGIEQVDREAFDL